MEQRAHITQKMGELKKLVLNMAAMSEKAVDDAATAFMELDSERAEKVIDNDNKINQEECDLDKFNLELLALTQPMAKDLRFIVGGHAPDLQPGTHRGRGREPCRTGGVPQHPVRPCPLIPASRSSWKSASAMMSNAVIAFANEDVNLAGSVCAEDEIADALHYKILKRTINNMVDESRMVERGVHHIMASRHLERVADLSTNIAEIVIFIAKGPGGHQAPGAGG